MSAADLADYPIVITLPVWSLPNLGPVRAIYRTYYLRQDGTGAVVQVPSGDYEPVRYSRLLKLLRRVAAGEEWERPFDGLATAVNG